MRFLEKVKYCFITMKIINWIFASIPRALFFSMGWMAVSIILTFRFQDWLWFGRSGSILTLFGAALAVRRLLRLGPERLFHETMVIDLGHIIPTPEEIEAARQTKLDVTASHLGILLVLVGTIIWGYGDLIQHFFPDWYAAPVTPVFAATFSGLACSVTASEKLP